VIAPSSSTRARRSGPTLTLPAPPVTVAKAVEAGLDDPRVELADGLCVVRSWPTPLETRVTQRLAVMLREAAPDDLDVLTLGARLRLGDAVDLAPDIMVVDRPATDEGARDEPLTPDDRVSPIITTVPRLVIEVAERADGRFDRTYKIDLYRSLGIQACWLIDTDGPMVEVFEQRDGGMVAVRSTTGSARLSLTIPVPITIVPTDLVDPPDPA
jgi:Uma2 family endonuclease